MTTPTYLGGGRPAPSDGNGLLGRLGTYLSGSGTPSYAGAGQPASTNNGGLLRPATPAYAAPVRPIAEVAPATDADAVAEASASCADACPIDPEALAAGHIAIVIPRT